MYIETARIIIRNFEERDTAGLYEYLAAPPVNCFYSEKVNSYDEAAIKLKERQKVGFFGNCYAVCLCDSNFIIGEVFAKKEGSDTYSVGWNFNLNYSGKGYATEAAEALFNYLFEKDARRIYAYAEDDNIPSQKLCERLGMRKEGLFLEFISFINNPDGTPHYENTYQYAILKKEWKNTSLL
ncbi:Protein N-acetyltransferase, RimJ/RimL family [Sporobacter termitidis DSM 10068]|uniref:Protein N-acetyltransferase, RimJ/RimL family n=1 Tax=Sporobacter termitidis DSM 10068 TaxID=1123282 RepID=A0A1M5Z6T2_9FIRM|nr:GNAT family protein [Sporobacter termitidis]SHI19985.1 Protein N-acetyltransferase, RimJ/RimL family [Sporobacter termitidis DSM 10068]